MKNFISNKYMVFALSIIVVLFVVISCDNTIENNSFKSVSKTVSALNNLNSTLLSSKNVARTLSFNPNNGRIVQSSTQKDTEEDDPKISKEEFNEIALADFIGAARGWKHSKYVPYIGDASTLIIKASVTVIISTLYSAKAYGDIIARSTEEGTKALTINTPMLEKLSTPSFLVASNRELTKVEVEVKKEELSDDVELPTSYQPLMEIGARHNLLLERIVNNEGEPLYENVNDSEYEFLTTEEFTLFYQEEYNYLLNTPTGTNLYMESDDSTMVDEVINLFIEAFDGYPDDIEDVQELVNHYISTIEEFNELNEEEKQFVYSGLCVAFASANYWNGNSVAE